MSEPYWTPLGGQPVDYEGDYNPATQYAPGDVVLYNGVYYVAVNPSQGSTPPAFAPTTGAGIVPLVTALPASPFDGQEVILTDSLTAPTYQWRLRYVAAKASNKWIFLGGKSPFAEVVTDQQISGATYTDPATPGPSLTAPVTGEYTLEFSFYSYSVGNVGIRYMAPKFGAATALDADAAYARDAGSTATEVAIVRRMQRTVTAGTVIKMQYRHTTAQAQVSQRWFSLIPVAVGG